jgi:glycosyltransferase involved in cell wall biosynthesis
MRLLVLSDTPFLPPTAGNRRRIDEMLRYFETHGVEVGMLMLPAADVAEWDTEGMRARLARFAVAEGPPPRGRLSRVVGRIAPHLGRSLGVDDWCPMWFRARAAELVREWQPAVVLAEYVFLSACLEDVSATRGHRPVTVVDTHDVMHRRRAVYDAAGLRPQWFHTSRAEERRGLARADVVLAIQGEEAALFREMLPGKTVLTVPHGQPITPAPADLAQPGRLLFVASYNDLNVRGFMWFVNAIWPALRAAPPGAELHVCGTIAAKLPAMPAGITVRGTLRSLDAEYAAARVVINPVTETTGLPIKLVEALCHGRPVVSRAGAADGVLAGRSPEEFVAATRSLLEDGLLWNRAAGAAIEHARRRFSSDAAFAPLLGHLRSRIGPTARGAA